MAPTASRGLRHRAEFQPSASAPAHTSASSGRPPARSSPPSRRPARGRHPRRPPAADAAVLDRRSSCARTRFARADTTLLLIDPELAAFVEPVAGDPPMMRLDNLAEAAARCRRLRAPHRRPSAGHPPVHQRLHVRARRRDAARARVCSNLRRHRRPPCKPTTSSCPGCPPRHGFGGHAHRAHDDRSGPRARCAPRLPRVARPLAAMALRLPRHGHGRSQLLVGARHACPATHGRSRPLSHAHRPERSRTGRSRHRRSLHRRGRPFRHASRSRVPGFRHGRGVHRRRVPRSAHRPAHRFGRSQGSRIRALRRARRSLRSQRAIVRPGCRPVPGLQMRVVDPSTGRKLASRGGRARDPHWSHRVHKNPEATTAAFRNDWL